MALSSQVGAAHTDAMLRSHNPSVFCFLFWFFIHFSAIYHRHGCECAIASARTFPFFPRQLCWSAKTSLAHRSFSSSHSQCRLWMAFSIIHSEIMEFYFFFWVATVCMMYVCWSIVSSWISACAHTNTTHTDIKLNTKGQKPIIKQSNKFQSFFFSVVWHDSGAALAVMVAA